MILADQVEHGRNSLGLVLAVLFAYWLLRRPGVWRWAATLPFRLLLRLLLRRRP